MVTDTSSSTSGNNKSNKGTNVRSDTFPAVHNANTESETSVSTGNIPNRSLVRIKNELQTVFDLMGPSTPALTSRFCNTSSEADNESSTAELNSTEPICTCSLTQSDNNHDSMLVDIATSSSTDNLDSVCQEAAQIQPHICLNPNCICMMGYMNQTTMPVVPPKVCQIVSNAKTTTKTEGSCKKRGVIDWIRSRSVELMVKRSNSSNLNPCELYKVNISTNEEDCSRPKRLVFDLVEGIPKPEAVTVATNTKRIRKPIESIRSNPRDPKEEKNERNCVEKSQISLPMQKNTYYDSNGNTRVDFYYFDHGNAHYFHTTDSPPVMVCEVIAEKTERYTTRFWAEFFTTIHIAFAFCVSFLLQLFKFILYSIVRPLTVGLMQLGSDYFFKPCLTTLFNGILQPALIFLYNVATSVRDLFDPIAECSGYFCRELAVLFRAIRLCTYKREDSCDCNKKHKCTC